MDMKGVWLILLTSLISGISIFLNSYAVKGFDSSVFTFTKNIVVAVLLFTIIFAISKFKEFKHLAKNQWKQLVIIGLVGGSIPFLLFFKGLQMTTGTTGSFLHKTLFIFSSMMALFFLKEKINRWTIFGVLGILAGTFVMIRPDFKFSIGHILILIAVFFWAAENILAKKALEHISGNMVAWGRMFFGSLFIFGYILFTRKTSIILSMKGEQYVWIIITSALLLLYVITYYNGLKYTSVTIATALLSLGAPITAVLSWIFGKGTIAAYDIIGMLLMTAGCVSIIWYASKTSVRTYAGV